MDPLSRLRASRLARAARAAASAGRDALAPRAALKRAARRVVAERAAVLAAGRPILDLSPQQARDTRPTPGGPFGVARCVRPPEPSQAALDAVASSLARGGQLVLAVPPEHAGPWHDRLGQQFLHVARVSLTGTTPAEVRCESSGGHAGAILEMLTASAPLRHLPEGPLRLHVGSGAQRLEGWVNVDIRPFPGVDLVADVTRGLEIHNVEAVYAEHFLEHLAVDDAVGFLVAVQRMLREGGRLRLSTPNLDWVWQTHYRLEATPEQKQTAALALNRAFHGWGHRFVWNRETLGHALQTVGFRNLTWHLHGQSDVELFRGLERHETYGDTEDLPHVLIVEAEKGQPDEEGLEALRSRFKTELLDHVAGY